MDLEGSSSQAEETYHSPESTEGHSSKEVKFIQASDSCEEDSEEETRPAKIRKVSDAGYIPQLKKAKYLWQIKGKGKYQHLTSINELGTSDENSGNIHVTGECSLDLNRLEEHTCSIDTTVLQKSDSISGTSNAKLCSDDCVQTIEPISHLSPDNRVAEGQEAYNENMEVDLDLDLFSIGTEEFFRILAQIPLTIGPEMPSERVLQCVERFLSFFNRSNHNLWKWQTKQLAKGIIDNAINKVLEEMGLSPERGDIDSLDNAYAAQTIEVEGVSEAIRQQGLFYRGLRENWNLAEAVSMSTLSAGNLSGARTLWGNDNENSSNNPLLLSCACETSEFQSDDQLLDTAVSCAISQKGLSILSHNE